MASDNHVFLRGRLADAAIEKDLPSGDVLVTFRLTVSRPPGERGRVDSLECVSTKPAVRRKLERAEAGDHVEVTGSLRRRFWRSPAGPASRYSVDTSNVRVIRAGRRAGARRARKPASA
ncbi:MAG: single-stranded DNA-binding protein [Jatrophihabitans sp.]